MDVLITGLFESPLKLGLVAASLASAGYVVSQRCKTSSQALGNSMLPPGPPRRFLIGNLLHFPRDHFYERFSEWQKEYGDIVSIDLLGKPIVVLNSYSVAQDLLIKRPNTTSGRDIPYMIRELMGWQWSLSIIQPGSSHRNQRKMLRRGIGPQRIKSHDPIVEKSINMLLPMLNSLEGNPHSHLLRVIGKLVIDVAYGEKMLLSMTEELSSWNLEAMRLASSVMSKFWLVDIFNSLRFIPSWFPGASFQLIGARSRYLMNQIRNIPYSKAHELYQSGKMGHSLATDLFDEFGPNDDARDALAILYSAGADTTSAAVMAFIHALYLFPDISQKVYDEITTVTDGTRIPNIADRPNMPYTEAVWMEAFRWRTFFPIGGPHASTEDEIVNGYFIKSGTQIIPNNWSILMDETVWGDSDTFRPERFLGPEADSLPNPLTVIFGYGMRVCPGMYLADRVGFHVGAAIAALYDIVPLEGRSRPNPESITHTDDLIRLPIGFECRFIPRDERSRHLLKVIANDK